MKNFFYIIWLSLFINCSNLANAQSLIAVSNESGSKFFASLDSAIVNAKSGDYIYLPGGSYKLTVPINKQLHIIGAGHHPDSCSATGITMLSGNIYIRSGSDHGSISGVKITTTVNFSPEGTLNYYYVNRCNLSSVYTSPRCQNILINECVINGIIQFNFMELLQITRCIIMSDLYYLNSNCYFENNIFFNKKGSAAFSIYQVDACTFKNNIFVGVPFFSSSYNNLCQNNAFINNYSGQPQQFINNIVVSNSDLFIKCTKEFFDYDQDYHINSTSAAHHAGTDGTDLGIYGTQNPWKEASIPENPHIQYKNITSNKGILTVNIRVAAQSR